MHVREAWEATASAWMVRAGRLPTPSKRRLDGVMWCGLSLSVVLCELWSAAARPRNRETFFSSHFLRGNII
eukprot:280913-Chlamydomonas_euryale.AAC.2